MPISIFATQPLLQREYEHFMQLVQDAGIDAYGEWPEDNRKLNKKFRELARVDELLVQQYLKHMKSHDIIETLKVQQGDIRQCIIDNLIMLMAKP